VGRGERGDGSGAVLGLTTLGVVDIQGGRIQRGLIRGTEKKKRAGEKTEKAKRKA